MIPLLTRIQLSGVHGLPSLDLTLPRSGGRPAPLVVTGPAGSGKTRLLEAIIAAKEACAAYGIHPKASAWFDDPSQGSVSLIWSTTSAAETSWAPADPLRAQRVPEALRSTLRDYGPDPSGWKLEYFNAARRLDAGPAGEVTPMPRISAGERIGTTRSKYDFVRAYLCTAALEDAASVTRSMEQDGLLLASEQPSRQRGFGARLSELGDKLVWLGIRQEGAEISCVFARRTGAGAREVELAALSGSECMLVLVAATVEALGLGKSLVLIDTPELGLHPEDHVRMFEGLKQTMREGQLIVATTSPAILRSVPSDHVVVLPSP